MLRSIPVPGYNLRCLHTRLSPVWDAEKMLEKLASDRSVSQYLFRRDLRCDLLLERSIPDSKPRPIALMLAEDNTCPTSNTCAGYWIHLSKLNEVSRIGILNVCTSFRNQKRHNPSVDVFAILQFFLEIDCLRVIHFVVCQAKKRGCGRKNVVVKGKQGSPGSPLNGMQEK